MSKKSEIEAAKAFFANCKKRIDDLIYLNKRDCECFVASLCRKLGLNIFRIKQRDWRLYPTLGNTCLKDKIRFL